MAPRRAVALAVLAALLAVPGPALAGWTQAGGDASHAGRSGLGDLDVVGSLRVYPDGVAPADAAASPQLVDTGAGLVALGRRGTDCVLVLVVVPANGTEASGPIACPQGGRLAGWDPGAGRALVCIDGTSMAPLLQARPLGASEPAWTHAPPHDAPDPLALVPVGNGLAGTWGCRAPAIAGDRAIVPFSSQEGRNRIEAVALADGATIWSSSVPSSVFLDAPLTVPGLPPLPALPLPAAVQDASGAFAIDGAVVTATGIVVSGRLDGTTAVQAPPGLAWFGPDGVLHGAYSLSPGADPTAVGPTTLTASSALSAANGPLAAHLVGDALVVVNPANAQGTRTALGTPSLGQTDLAAPCWARDTLVVPGEAAAFLVPSADPSSIATWGGFGGGRIQACTVTGASAWMVVTRIDNGTRADLVEVSLLTARSVRRLPLPVAPGDAAALGMSILPLGDGSLLVTAGAQASVLAPLATAKAPQLRAESRYPGTDSAAAIHVDLPGGAPKGTRLLLAWGDGLLEEVEPGRHSHTYGDGGDRTVRLTAVSEDGQTATAAKVLHVGASPPKPRGLLEVAFAPENQNYTFTALGLLVTLGGALIAALGVHRGRHRLERHLAALDRIRDAGRREPFGAIRSLHDFREERRADLGKGNLEDAQYVVLEAGATETLQLLRQRILGTFVGRVSDLFSHALDLALADGSIDDAEGAGLLEIAKREKDLTGKERDDLAGLVRSWQRVI